MHFFFSFLVFLLLDRKFQVYPCTLSGLICNLKGTVQMSKCHSKHISRGLTAVVCCVRGFLVCFFVFRLVGWVCLFGLFVWFVVVFVFFCLCFCLVLFVPQQKRPITVPSLQRGRKRSHMLPRDVDSIGKKDKRN